MKMNERNVLVVDDNVFKSIDIKRALEYNGISKVTMVDVQEDVWKLIKEGERFDLIVTDMHYPLHRGEKADHKAGFILIEKMKEKGIDIPVIICSTRNFTSSDVLGTVWYSELKDINLEFKNVLGRLEK